jgi:hypothetical protein
LVRPVPCRPERDATLRAFRRREAWQAQIRQRDASPDGRGVLVVVTHQYELARGFYDRHLPAALFLRAERRADGTRTFKIAEGQPLQTSFGEDLYRRIFVDSASQRHDAAFDVALSDERP